MSSAIVHFLAGYGTVLIIITLLYRFEYIDLIPQRNILGFIGGIWGLGPDIHHMIENEWISESIYTVHNNRISDIFFLHYTLDLPQVEAYYHEFIALSILYVGFCITITYYFGVLNREKRIKNRSS